VKPVIRKRAHAAWVVCAIAAAGCGRDWSFLPDADGADVSDGDAGACPRTAGNLLTDPSFESWVDGRSPNWEANGEGATFGPTTDNVAHCRFAGVFDGKGYATLRQSLSGHFPPNQKFFARARVRWMAGSGGRPALILFMQTGTDLISPSSSFEEWSTGGPCGDAGPGTAASMGWCEHSATFTNTLAVDAEEISFQIAVQDAVVAIDDVEVRLVVE
jgi:hypothetical protein